MRITVNRGTTKTLGYKYIYNGSVGSLVGGTIRFTAKVEKFDDSSDDTTALVKKDITVHTDAENGESQIILQPADTVDIKPGTYWYDIVVEEASGARYRTHKGPFIVSGGPTNRLS